MVNTKSVFQIGDTVSFMWGTKKRVGTITRRVRDTFGGRVWEVTNPWTTTYGASGLYAYFPDYELTPAVNEPPSIDVFKQISGS
jgi:hypothetical protein